jgi:2,3-bisphosphoglycerate-independent phosphoglycerate mutase
MSAPIVLVVLDGYGLGDGGAADATEAAHSPFLKDAVIRYPTASIETSGEAVGLPPGQMGNSEVGHMTMGAGRVIEQDLTRISRAFRDMPAEQQLPIRELFEALKKSGGTLHLMGLVSDGGVHSHIEHLEAILASSARAGIPTAVHAFLDGRDTPPRSGLVYMEALMPRIEATGAHVATVSGRYYAMDRDSRWERISQAYHAIACGQGEQAASAIEAIEAGYGRGEGDEFMKPTVIAGGRLLEDGDAVFFANFRADRARELTCAIASVCEDRYAGQLERRKVADLSGVLCLTEYDAAFDLPIAFPPDIPRRVLGEIVSAAGVAQLRMAETEKYAHVTFFFNSGIEDPFPDEDRALIPSPRDVDTYDHRPEMSALQLTQTLLARLEEGDYGFVLVNFANPDMVGHTGVMDAAVKAVETIDSCLDELAGYVLERGGQMLVTADHGNCEQMVDPETGEPHTAHTTNPVPIYWITRDTKGLGLRDGSLTDVAPTVLELLGLAKPDEMTGTSLIVPHRA